MYILDIQKHINMYKHFVAVFVTNICSALLIFSLLLNTVFFCPTIFLMSPLNFKDSKLEQLTNIGLKGNILILKIFTIHFPQGSDIQNMLTIQYILIT
jgi:hypothetical protein